MRARASEIVVAASVIRPRYGFRSPVSASIELGLAVAVDAGDADDLAGPHLEGDALEPLRARGRRAPEVVDASTAPPASPALLSTREQHLAADHQPRELASVAPAAGTRPDILPRRSTRDPVGDLQHLVELVADEDDRHPLARQLRRMPNSSIASCGVSTAVGSSRMRMSAPPVQRLEDLDALLLADRDVLDARRRVDREAERLGELLDPPACGVA